MHFIFWGGGRPSYDAAAVDYFDRAEALGGSFNQTAINASYTEAYIKQAISDFVTTCKSDGVWDKLTEIYLLSHVSFGGLMAKLKYASVAELTNNGFVSGDYLAAGNEAGLKGDESSYLTSANADTLVTNANCLLMMYQTEAQTDGEFLYMQDGAGGASDTRLALQPKEDEFDRAYGSACGYRNEYRHSASAAPSGDFACISDSPTTALYSRGALLGSEDEVDLSSGAISRPLVLFGEDRETAASGTSDARVAMFAVGTAISGTEYGNLATAVNALMTTIGANVY